MNNNLIITFENCDSLTIKGKFYVQATGITKNIGTYAGGSVVTSNHAERVTIHISKTLLDMLPKEDLKLIKTDNSITLLSYFINDTNTTEQFYVPWGDHHYINTCQTIEERKDGSLHITFEKK